MVCPPTPTVMTVASPEPSATAAIAPLPSLPSDSQILPAPGLNPDADPKMCRVDRSGNRAYTSARLPEDTAVTASWIGPPRSSQPPVGFQPAPSHHLWKRCPFVPRAKTSARLGSQDVAAMGPCTVPPRVSHSRVPHPSIV